MDKIMQLAHQMKTNLDIDWTVTLEQHGIWPEVAPLYERFSSPIANTLFCFVVLAYHRESGWLWPHKDRQENKNHIMTLLDAEFSKDPDLKKAAQGRCKTTMLVIRWLMDYQKDWRWQSIETCYSFHSRIMSSVAAHEEEDEPKKERERGQALSEALDKRREGDKLLKEIQAEFQVIDDILETEGLGKLTDEGAGPGTWETYLKRRKARIAHAKENGE